MVMIGQKEFEYYEEQYSYKQYEQELLEEEIWDKLLEEAEEEEFKKG